jgi:hypothetical protein
MPLRDLDLAPSDDPIPPDVARFLREADRRIDIFQDACRVPGFVPSDYSSAYRVLRAVANSGLARGRQFCEWGSGFGVVACLAAMLDFDSCGVEVETILVEQARQLAEDFELSVEFAAGSYVPRGAEDRVHRGGSYSWFATEGDFAYDDLGLEPVDMDVVFAYPWPDEEPVTLDLFQRYCASGAILITFHGGEDFRVRRNRKRGKKRRPS